jgi:hypothetical protein
LVERILELFSKILDDKRRPLGFSEVQGLSVVTKFDGVNPNEIHLRLVLGRNRFNHSDISVLVLK